jgi:hypothetical protein
MRIEELARNAVLAYYGLSKRAGEDLGLVARGPMPFKPLDPAMQRVRDARAVSDAFDGHAEFDRTSPMATPGVIHRAEG